MLRKNKQDISHIYTITMTMQIIYLYIKILKKLNSLKGKPQDISKGFATGVAMSFTPFVGFHILLSLFVAKIFKQNGTAATLGTIFGNPWTFPFIWYLTLHTGYLIVPQKIILNSKDFKIFSSSSFTTTNTIGLGE